MLLACEVINPITYQNWKELLLACENYTFFLSANWAHVLRESYQYTPTYFTLFDHNKLQALIPVMEIDSMLTGRRGISLPFTDYCEPVAENCSQFQDLFDRIITYGKKKGWKVLELRGGGNFFQDAPHSSQYLRHTLDLSKSEEHVFSAFRDSTKRNIKKAISEGVDVKLCTSIESINEFYRLNCLTRKEHGLPPQPYYFFKKVYEDIISKNLGFVALASYNNKIIAGAMYFYLGEKAVYKYGASDKKYHHLRANNLVMWEAIRWYCKAGFKNFCFGRTEFDNPGLRQFKNGWGTKETIIYYYKYDLTKDAFITDNNDMTAFYHKVFKKTPVSVLKILGSLLYKHIG
jgi:hypothetical protein